MLNWNDLRGGLSECGREIEVANQGTGTAPPLESSQVGDEGVGGTCAGRHGNGDASAFRTAHTGAETQAAQSDSQTFTGLTIERLISAVEKAEEHADEQPETITEEELWGDSQTAHEQSQSQFGDGSRYL